MRTIKDLLFFLTLFHLASCSVEKRHYMSGYSINWKSNHYNKTNESDFITNKTCEPDEYPITCSENSTIYLPSKSASANYLPDSCDLMELKDNSKLLVKIVEIRASDIKYRICGTPSDSALTINKSEVIGIDFSNGLKGEFDSFGKLKPKKEKKISELSKNENGKTDSAYYKSKKIVVPKKGKYTQNGLALSQVQFWRIIEKNNNPAINKLLKESKKQVKLDRLGLLIIPLGIFMLNFPLIAIWTIPITWLGIFACMGICALAIIFIAIVSHRGKRKRLSADGEASKLYNEDLLK